MLGILMAAWALAGSLQTHPDQHDRAGNGLTDFVETRAATEDRVARACTTDGRWCAEIDNPAEPTLTLFAGRTSSTPRSTLTLDNETQGDLSLWSRVLQVAGPEGDLMIGVQTSVSTGYSGGGASATQLALYRFPTRAGGTAHKVLDVPISGSSLIRACFSERDMKDRRGACHDEYSFDGALSLDPNTVTGMPRLRFKTTATAFPGPVSRLEDSLAKGPLRDQDLVVWRDPVCSYRRAFVMDPTTGQYAPDSPLPECESYTVP